ncbi:MAG: DUF2334 domain-containing protein [Saprospiraceae bacterium]|nr:DUF2334 domain-containing protein [Saprospiraceae bacterium]
MFNSKIIIRIDDVCETMDWDSFFYFKRSLEELQIRAILGVIPDCKDQSLMLNEARGDFYDLVREWRDYGDTIAQHGYDHIYVSSDPGLMGINNSSEFSGLSYQNQFQKLSAGKEIMVKQDIWEPHFMAPAHSFDDITIECLIELGFKTITDGYGFFPYRYREMTLVPQLFSQPIPLPFGVQTIAVHTNYESRERIDNVLNFLKLRSDSVISYSNAIQGDLSSGLIKRISRSLTETLVKASRK